MSRFTDARYELSGGYVHGRPLVCLTTPLTYMVGHLNSGAAITAPAGFCTDLASLPGWVLRFEWGRRLARKLARSAIVHDLLRSDRRWSKWTGDVIFLEAMGVDGDRPAWRIVAFLAVLINFSRD